MSSSDLLSLTDMALLRLRKLADGNGIDPQKIVLLGSEEKTYDITGTLTLKPKCEVVPARYPGGVRGKGRSLVSDPGALQSEINRRRDAFMNGSDWVEISIKELKAAPGKGWGLDDAHVTRPEKSAILACTSPCHDCSGQKLLTCNHCHGHGTLTCTQCNGRGHETCLTCGGQGVNPAQPTQPCPTCRGTRQMVCRICRGSTQMTCPTCHGRRGTPCPGCMGTGQFTDEAAINCSAETHFKLDLGEAPSGLRRGLSRLGTANLARGYADIEIVPPPKAEGEEGEKSPDAQTAFTQQADVFRQMALSTVEASATNDKSQTTPPVIHYRAKLPYADIRLDINGKKAMIAAFGKRCILMGVPPFLDEALKPWLEKLKFAAADQGGLDKPLEMRVIRDALALEVGPLGNVDELRRLYPLGLSPAVASEILGNLRRALSRSTQKQRAVMATAIGAGATTFFGILFFSTLHDFITHYWEPLGVLLFDAIVLAFTLAFSEAILSRLVRRELMARHPNLQMKLRQRTGKTGIVMLAGITFMYLISISLAPIRPSWIERWLP
jgi:hypothetical protein